MKLSKKTVPGCISVHLQKLNEELTKVDIQIETEF